MRTTLPLPQQPGFQLVLPERLRFAPDTLIEQTLDGVRISRNEVILTITIPGPARMAFITRATDPSAYFESLRLAPVWRQLLQKCAAQGLMSDATRAVTAEFPVSAIDAIRLLRDRMHEVSTRSFGPGHPFGSFAQGGYSRSAAARWIVQNYHYTKSAPHHISPLFRHAMDEEERALWTRFLKDESWHWRIYRPILGELGMSFEDVDACAVHPATHAFIEALRSCAANSIAAYAAALMFAELPPTVDTLDQDPLYGALVAHYGFRHTSVRPLWWHSMENLEAGHSDLAAVVLSRRRSLSPDELAQALNGLTRTIQAVSSWHQGVLSADS
ncbi:hypothetical protein [Nonomuraea sp. NPDC049758]|uniref:hypothetical protein n=1 Tax=Nonomuraea sp. NPDC049758 TaxID=3154360 RepID=UPI003423F6B8